MVVYPIFYIMLTFLEFASQNTDTLITLAQAAADIAAMIIIVVAINETRVAVIKFIDTAEETRRINGVKVPSQELNNIIEEKINDLAAGDNLLRERGLDFLVDNNHIISPAEIGEHLQNVINLGLLLPI
jgi:hypothetical protein